MGTQEEDKGIERTQRERERGLEAKLATLLERESNRASELAASLESAAAVAAERDSALARLSEAEKRAAAAEARASCDLSDIQKHLSSQRQVIGGLRESLQLEGVSDRGEGEQQQPSIDISGALQEQLALQNSELLKILNHINLSTTAKYEGLTNEQRPSQATNVGASPVVDIGNWEASHRENELLKWKAHAEEVIEAMKRELSEAIGLNVEMEQRVFALADEKRRLVDKVNFLQNEIENTDMKTDEGSALRILHEKYENLQRKYLRQGKRTRALQNRLLQIANAEDLDLDELGVNDGSDSAPPAASSPRRQAWGRATSQCEQVELEQKSQAPIDVLRMAKSINDDRRRLYTAPSSQNRRPLPPEIPAPMNALESQRLANAHRGELQSAPSSQYMSLKPASTSSGNGRPISAPSSSHRPIASRDSSSAQPSHSHSSMAMHAWPEEEVGDGIYENLETPASPQGRRRQRPAKYNRPASAAPTAGPNRARKKKGKRPSSARPRMQTNSRSPAGSPRKLNQQLILHQNQGNGPVTIPLTPNFATTSACADRRCGSHPSPRGMRVEKSDLGGDGKPPWK